MQTIVPKMNFITYSLGCRTNQAELEDISLQLTDYGLRQGHATGPNLQPLTPNLVLINTCMVTSKAERETRKAIRHLKKLYPQAKIVVLGCAVTAKDKFKIDLPKADLLISNEEKQKSVQIILDFVKKYSASIISVANNDSLYCYSNNVCHLVDLKIKTNLKSNYEESGRKFIKIQDGCSNCCSFCITTHLRGEPRSEEPEKIIDLINELTNLKIKELILTGINIGQYGVDLKPRTSIWALVDRIVKETKVERLTLSTVYPEMLYGLRTVLCHRTVLCNATRNPRFTKCFHLALQSGSPSVLMRMNRPTDLKKLLKATIEIRKIQPDFTFRADVIAGFPDETEEEHEETLNFIRQAKISFAHVFPYSPRIGTVAYQMIQQKKWRDLPMEVKRRRAREIRLLVGRLSSELSGGMVGKTYRVLVVREVGEKLEGITDNGWKVIVQNSKCKVQNQIQSSKFTKLNKGNFTEVKITGYKNGQLLGEILSLPI